MVMFEAMFLWCHLTVLHYTYRCFDYFVQHIYINEERLDDSNTSPYSAKHFISTAKNSATDKQSKRKKAKLPKGLKTKEESLNAATQHTYMMELEPEMAVSKFNY